VSVSGVAPESPELRGAVRRFLHGVLDFRSYGILYAVVGLFVVLALTSESFLTQRNLLNVCDAWAPIAIMALGGTIVLLTGGFDLSIGGIYVVCGVVATSIANDTNAAVGLLAGLGAGAALGAVNSIFITGGRMNPFVATIGTSIMFGGLATVISGGLVIAVTDMNFDVLGNKYLGVNASIWILVIAIALCSFLLNRTTFGRYIRAVGGNSAAARLSGVRVKTVMAGAYIISGLSGGIAADIVASGSLSSSNSTAVAFSVWAAILLGGNSMYGGVGSVWRTIAGTALLALIQNGFTLLGVGPVYQEVATGAIFLLAVAIDSRFRRSGGEAMAIQKSNVW
jgi:ribose transport system permease protein